MQSGQFVAHVYKLHKVAFAQTFSADLKRLGLSVEELISGGYQRTDRLFDLYTNLESDDDCVQVLEFWFKQPFDVKENGKTIPAGAVACSIQAGGKELRYIPMYWENTYRQCNLFPFVHYWRIRDENGFYNKSELFAIKDLVDAGDRKFGNSLLNDAMMSNDIILTEENAFADGCEPTNEPGSIWTMKPNKIGAAARLGGLQSGAEGSNLTNFLSEQIQRTTRNYDTNLGRETSRQTTATGLSLLRDDADTQADIKKNDRLRGFERLYELIDWLCLEFFDDERLLFIGAKDQYSESIPVKYNANNYAQDMPAVFDPRTNEQVREGWTYYPKVDVTVNAGDGIIKGKQATAAVLEKLAGANVNQANYQILAAELDILDIPQKKAIQEYWDKLFGSKIPPEVTQALENDPELLNAVIQTVMAAGGEENAVP